MSSTRSSGTLPARALAPWYALAVIVVIADQATKAAVLAHLAPGQRYNVLPFFDLTLWFNTGAAFSFLAWGGGWQRWAFTALGLVAAIVLARLIARYRSHLGFVIGLALILGGDIGNLIDRILLARVTDFLLFYWDGHYFPAFNVADSAITVGVALLLLFHSATQPTRRA